MVALLAVMVSAKAILPEVYHSFNSILMGQERPTDFSHTLMTLTCYWHFDDLPPCRLGVAYALSHFALLAFTLRGFYLQETDAAIDVKTWNQGPPPLPLPERELAVYAGPFFALLLPSQLVTIILKHIDAWQAHREQLIMALRLTEGNT